MLLISPTTGVPSAARSAYSIDMPDRHDENGGKSGQYGGEQVHANFIVHGFFAHQAQSPYFGKASSGVSKLVDASGSPRATLYWRESLNSSVAA